MAKAKQTPAEVVTEESGNIVVTFLGFLEESDMPEHGDLLVVGQQYEVQEVLEGDAGEQFYLIEIENPNFNSKKKESATNSKTLAVEVLSSEAEVVGGEEGAGGNNYPEMTIEDMVVGQRVWGSDDEGDFEGVVSSVGRDRSTFQLNMDDGSVVGIAVADVTDMRLVEDVPAKTTTTKETTKKATAKAPAKEETTAKASAKVDKAKATAPAKETVPAKAEAKKPGRPPKTAAPVTQEAAQEEDDGMFVLAPEMEDQDILLLVDGAEDLFELVRTMVAEDNRNQYTLGGVLYHIRLNKEYKELSPEYAKPGGFQLFVQEQLGVGYRKAMNLIDIYTKFNLYGIGADAVQTVGWSKSALIARHISEDNQEELLEMATTLSAKELSTQLTERYSAAGEDDRPRTKFVGFKFRLVESQADQVKSILEQAAAATGQKMEQVFASIVTEWGLEHLHTEDDKASTRSARSGKATSTEEPVQEKKAARASTRSKAGS